MSSVPSAASLPGFNGVEEWRELESDPGVFSLLLEDYGVRGVKLEEVYDVTKKFESKVFGFVFLFRYELTDRRARKKAREVASETDCYVLDSNVINRMFFAHQIISNSCATHALLSVVLNCENLDIGPNLKKLKAFTQDLDPESKGFAIANMMELAHIHNKHARPPRPIIPPIGRKSSFVSSSYALVPETYHFVSFVPINGRLFELDGLKEYPIDHGPWGEHERWTDLFQRTVTVRLTQSQDFLFNLMALIQDPLPQISECLKTLQSEQNLLLENANKLAQEVNKTTPPVKQAVFESEAQVKGLSTSSPSQGEPEVKEEAESKEADKEETTVAENRETVLLGEVSSLLPADSAELDSLIATPLDDADLDMKLRVAVAKVVKNYKEIETYKQKLKEEIEIKQRFRVEHSRRIHDYDPFIFDFVKCLAHNKQLPERLLRRPSIVQPVRGGGGRQKKRRGGLNKKPRTTLLLNGSEVGSG